MQSLLAVVDPATTSNLTTRQRVKDELGIADKDTDSLIDAWIAEESAHIESYLNRKLGLATWRETFRAPFGRCYLAHMANLQPLQLRNRPIVSVEEVTEDGIELVEDTDFEIDPDIGRLWRLDGDGTRIDWPWLETIVEYQAGYALLDSLPRPIEQACIVLIKHRWHARRRDPMVKSDEIAGIGRTEFWVGAMGGDAGMPPEAESLLGPYREFAI